MKTEYYLQIILTMVADECGESVGDICSDCRRMELVRCRTMYCAIAWQLLHPTLRQIAGTIGRCVTNVQVMILNHPGITDRMYVAQHAKLMCLASEAIFKS